MTSPISERVAAVSADGPQSRRRVQTLAKSRTAVAAILLLVSVCSCGPRPSTTRGADAASGALVKGGSLTAAIRDDPPTFNPYVGRTTNVVEVLTHLLHASLVRVDRRTGELTPALAEHWTASPDGLTLTLTLRKGVRFSDGVPFTSSDVVFAFEAVYDPRSVSPIGDSLLVAGRKIGVAAPDSATAVLTFPVRPAGGLQVLANLPILPRHKLEAALRGGQLKDRWTVGAAPTEIVGLGPFRLSSYRASEALELERNPFYWRRDRQGTSLPYLDHMTLAIVRDANTELLRIQKGQVDIGAREIRAEDYAALRRDELQGRVQLADAGVAADTNMLWFNLSSRAYANDSRKVWLQSIELRKAISHAVDRQAIVDQVFLGAAVPVFGPVTPGNRRWYTAGTPIYAHDPSRAAALLETLGLKDRDGDGVREDDNRRPVRFSILTQQQDTIRMRTLAVVQEHLRHVGIQIDIVGVDAGMIIQRWSAGAYDAIYFGAESTSYDPADNLDFWLSSGSFHIWNAEQETPSTEWEARIDELMHRQAAADSTERERLFAETQRILAEHQPVICFAAPRMVAALSPRVLNATPAPLKPLVLWNAETLAVSR